MNINVFFVALKKLCKKIWKIVKTEKKFFTTFFKNGINPPKINIFKQKIETKQRFPNGSVSD